jgi:hypothetical protein
VAKFVERAKSALEWLQHGDLIVRILGGLGGGQLVRAALVTWTHIPHVWVTAIWLIAVALFCWLLTLLGKRKVEKRNEPAETQIAATAPSPPQFKDVDEFYKTYDNALLLESEEIIRKESQQYKPGNDRERFLIRTLASGAITYAFDVVWYTIYNSQLRLLDALNSKPLPVIEAKKYYEQASQNYPIQYLTYSFDQWLSYLHSWVMVVQNGDTIVISVRGREFLKYLVHQGRSASDRIM